MAKTLTLEITRPYESKSVEILWVDVEGLNGSFVIGPDHSPLVSILKPKGRLVYMTKYNLEVEMDVFGGIIKINDNKAVIILDD